MKYTNMQMIELNIQGQFRHCKKQNKYMSLSRIGFRTFVFCSLVLKPIVDIGFCSFLSKLQQTFGDLFDCFLVRLRDHIEVVFQL